MNSHDASKKTIVFDSETSGLNLHPRAGLDKQPRMIEFAGLLMDNKGKTVEEQTFLVNPNTPLDYAVQKITGLRDADLADQWTFDDAFPVLAAFFSRAHTIIAHNLPFDMTIISNEIERMSRTDRNKFVWPARRICTVQTYRERYGRNPKLTELYEDIIGKKLEQRHRALDDVHALVEIVVKEGLYK